jgi:PAS domain S-box-containing protein
VNACKNLELERQIAKTEQTESRLAAIVESSEDAIMGKTLDGTITDWNAAAARLFGYEAHEIIGKSILLLVPPELHQEEREILSKLRAGERIAYQQSQRLTKKGTRVDVSLTISPIKNGLGQVIGASTIARDISERKRAEQALRISEKLAAAGRLAATIAHEINNPLEAVTNFIFLAKTQDGLPEFVRNYLEYADQELARVSHIARQTLGFYRDTTSPVCVNPAEVLDEILELYARKITYKDLIIERRYQPVEQINVLLGEMRQVFSNLLVNAIDASPERGCIRVRVSAVRDSVNRELGVRVTIADEGTGIAPEVRDKIFEPFFSTKRDVGTGLGLWISKTLIEKAGGSIRFRSSIQPQRSGTVFSLFLPSNAAAISQIAA